MLLLSRYDITMKFVFICKNQDRVQRFLRRVSFSLCTTLTVIFYLQDGTKSVNPSDPKVNTRFVAGLGLGEGYVGRQDRGEFSGYTADGGIDGPRGRAYRGFSGDGGGGGGRYSGYGGYEYTGTDKIRHKQSEMKHNR